MAQALGILSFEDARHTVEKHAASVKPGPVETVFLLDAPGRVLAEPLVADRDFPPFPRATRDGYAIRAEDVKTVPAELRIIGEIRAGAQDCALVVNAGEAVRIMTGAPVPQGANAVVMVEYTNQRGESMEISRTVSAGENVVPMGSEARQGELLLGHGTRLDESGIAVAASVGASKLRVHSRPKAAVLATGDEIVDIGTHPAPSQIRNSNSYSLAAQIAGAGATPFILPIAADDPQHLRKLIEQGLQSDLLLIAGGVSMGKYDLVEQVLTELGAEFFFTGAEIQPGKPIVFGKAGDKYFFGLPGNPVSTMVTFELFVRPMIEALSGMKARQLVFMHAQLKTDIKTRTGLKRFLPAILHGEFERAEVELARWQGSGDIAAAARSNCYIVVPPDRERISAGEWVAVLRK